MSVEVEGKYSWNRNRAVYDELLVIDSALIVIIINRVFIDSRVGKSNESKLPVSFERSAVKHRYFSRRFSRGRWSINGNESSIPDRSPKLCVLEDTKYRILERLKVAVERSNAK